MVSIKFKRPYPDHGYIRAELRRNKCGAFLERQTAPLLEEDTPFSLFHSVQTGSGAHAAS
jgi:hypothetical protein